MSEHATATRAPSPDAGIDGVEAVHTYAGQLRQYATQFEPRDWDYTSHHDIKRIRIRGEWDGYDHPLRRVKRWLDDYFRLHARSWCARSGRKMAWRHPVIHARTALGTDRHLPDGVLDGGNVITHWEETGEYLQYVQPSVGALIADLMDAHPDLPEVQAVAAEMKRINDRYRDRLAAGEPHVCTAEQG